MQFNALGDSTSLYLQQHAHQPVHWQEWNSEVLEYAGREQKLLVISIGYSSCHWCHVMAEESFDNAAVAAVMNQDFVNIKVDREERPDLDSRYMKAASLLLNSPGWPLNIVALPNGTPVWAATYLEPQRWSKALEDLQQIWVNKPEQLYRVAGQVKQGIVAVQTIGNSTSKEHLWKASDFEDTVFNWGKFMDKEHGGQKGRQKFPLFASYQFMLSYGSLAKDDAVQEFVHHTLDRILSGGIYDWIGGGLCRYTVDPYWKVPHFEKMLFDNAQLLHTLAWAYRDQQKAMYLQAIAHTTECLNEHFLLPSGLYGSAQSALSPHPKTGEVEEGAFYTWTQEELQSIIPANDWAQFSNYCSIAPSAAWNGKYILTRGQNTAAETTKRWRQLLVEERHNRTAPEVDPKAITAWNAMLVLGWEETHWAIPNAGYNQLALDLANQIHQQCFNGSVVMHTPHGEEGFLDDYALYAQCQLAAFRLSAQSVFAERAKEATALIVQKFPHHNGAMRKFTTADVPDWAVNVAVENQDVPAATAQWAKLIQDWQRLGVFTWDSELDQMLAAVQPHVYKYGDAYASWLLLALPNVFGHRELVGSGPGALQALEEVTQDYWWPNCSVSWVGSKAVVPIHKHREGEALALFLCTNGQCQLPMNQPSGIVDALRKTQM